MRPTDRDPSTAKFLRGMTLGALIGAVIAGSSLWSRRRPRHHADVARPAGSGPPAPVPVDDEASAGRP